MNRKIVLPMLVLSMAILACNLQAASPTPTASPATPATATSQPSTPTVATSPTSTSTPLPPTLTSTAAAVTSTPGVLTLDVLKNGTYLTPMYNRTITLVNGSYTEGSGANIFSVQMLDVYAFGDLNGDKKADAAILLAENGGGSGDFVSLIAVTDQNGKPHQQSTAQLGDRNLVKTMDISNGVIHLNMVVHAPNDPMCCPTLVQKQNFWLVDNKLWLMRVISTIAGTDHIINVDSPGIWATVTNPFTIKGSVTVLPFENTLAYRIFLTDGTKVNENPITVTPTTGTAGTFLHDFNLSAAGITDWVIIQFIDVSAADGSTTALGSVILKAH